MGAIIHLNGEDVKAELGEMVRKPVEETLNAMPDVETDEITQSHKYERTGNREDTRAAHYHQKLGMDHLFEMERDKRTECEWQSTC